MPAMSETQPSYGVVLFIFAWRLFMFTIASLLWLMLLRPFAHFRSDVPFPFNIPLHLSHHLNRLLKRKAKVPVSVNYHLTRRCNKACGFCFHTATTSHIEDLDKQKAALHLLAKAGMRKINFAGGEPFLYPKPLGAMVDFCKHELHLESVSIVTNGSLVKESFLREHGTNLDILAVSCDSFDEQTNIAIGRGTGDQVQKLYQIAEWCRQYGVMFKLNTVVNKLNVAEDMNAQIAVLRPFRWKAFQVLIVQGENDSEETLRNGHKFTISDAQFDAFCDRHRAQECLVPEPNRLMAKSYLILDEYLRFLDRTGKQPSQPILEVGVEKALESVFWDEDAFVERGGLYEWAKPEDEAGEKGGCGGAGGADLDW
jgi:radical S-adenosyl methionine domain-containing protein 2